MKLRSSTKIGIGAVALTVLAIGGYRAITYYMVQTTNFPPIEPGNVNIVGIDPGAGYRIMVSNQIAQLAQVSENFGGNESSEGGATEGAVKKRLPIKELLQTLQGNTSALGKLVMALNDMKENEDWPSVHIIWKAEDLKKALDGDKPLEAKLVQDLNMKLDGTPLPTLRPASLENGIIIDSPVPVNVNLAGKVTRLVGRVEEPYKPRMIRSVEKQLADKNVTPTMMMGYYAQAAQPLLTDPKQRENIRASLEDAISDQKARERAEAPERVLSKATVVINESFITNARYDSYTTNDGKKAFSITIDLTDEGRRRLWKFSTGRVGSQLLLVANGVAIQAPRIQHELAQGELTISPMPDETLVQDAVDTINAKNGTRSAALP